MSYTGIDSEVKDEFVGKPLGTFKVYHFLGVDSKTGKYIVADRNGNPTSTPDPDLDKTVFINLNPVYYGGFQNSISFKGISFDFLFQFVKQKGENGEIGENTPGYIASNQPITVLDRWKQAGDVVDIQRFGRDPSLRTTYTLAKTSDKSYSDASYIRLKNISLSYKVSEKWISAAHLQNARLFIQGQNLLTITNYVGGDPENRSFKGMPPLKVLTLGIQIGF